MSAQQRIDFIGNPYEHQQDTRLASGKIAVLQAQGTQGFQPKRKTS